MCIRDRDKLTLLVGDLSDKASGTYDIITANIVANAILSLAPAVPGLMAEMCIRDRYAPFMGLTAC